MTELRIDLLGEFRVAVGGRAVPVEAWRRRKPAALVKLLALAPRHCLHREQLMERLWPELDPDAAAANLRKALHHARRALGPEGGRLVRSHGELLCLASEGLVVDVDSFHAAIARARRDGDSEAYAEAVDLYDDGLLPEDAYEEWAIERRDELELDQHEILDELAALLESQGDLDGAVRVLRRHAAATPLREDVHVRLMRVCALAGRRDDALRQYEHLRELLGAELGIEPGPDAQRLHEELRARSVPEPELSVELWERVGELRLAAGDTSGAAKAFERALAAAAAGAEVARVQRKTADALLMQHDPGAAEPHLAAAEADVGDDAERGRLVRLRATQAWLRGELDRAGRLAHQARELAEAHGGQEDLAAAHETEAIVSHLRGEWREGLEAELLRLSEGGGAELARVFDIHHCIGQYHLYSDELAGGVEANARQILDAAEAAGAERAQAFAWCLLGESLLLRARWDEAAGCLERSCTLHDSLGTRAVALPWQRLAELAVCVGEHEEAKASLRRASAIATVSPMARHLWGRIQATAALGALDRGDAEGAVRSVRAAAAAAARYGDCPTCSALLNPVAAEAFAAVGDREGARAHADAAARVAASFESSAWRAMAEWAEASVAEAEGDHARSNGRRDAAAALYERAGHVYWAGRLRARRGNGAGTRAS